MKKRRNSRQQHKNNQYGAEYDITASTDFVLLTIHAEEGTPATKFRPF